VVRVKLFANFREIAGERELEIDAESVEELLKKLEEIYPEFSRLYEYAIVMVNGRSVDDFSVRLEKNDVVALLPPVSGG